MTRFLLCVLLCVVFCSPAIAGRVFISSSDTDPTATGDAVVGIGQSVNLYVWWEPDRDEVINGAALNIAVAHAGFFNAFESVVLNPTAGPFGPRYNGDPNNGNVDPADPNLLVEGMLGVSVNATGIDASINDFGDFDPTFVDGAMLYSQFAVTKLRPGYTTIRPAADPANPITAEGLGAVEVDFQGIAIGCICPEPGVACLGCVAMLGLAAVRCRKGN